METRYYITFAIVFVALQLLMLSFTKTVGWLFNLSAKNRKAVTFVTFFTLNVLAILLILRIFTAFRLMAFVLVFLLFAFFIRFLTACILKITKQNQSVNRGLKIAYPFMLAGLIGLGLYNAYTPKVLHYSVKIDKPLEKPLRIGMASDFHLGILFGAKQLDKLADIFNQEKVDMIFLPGDIMDDNVTAYRAENMQPHLARLRAPLGVFATMGNHDFLGDQANVADEIRKAGFTLLWDQAVEIDGKFTIIGRNDEMAKGRPSVEQLLSSVNTALPIFLLDHRPSEIEAHSALPIDVQVSGHVHNGQVFPANIITSLMYRLPYGYEKIGLGHYFVTSGYGFWGVPIRLGSQSEVMIIEVSGNTP